VNAALQILLYKSKPVVLTSYAGHPSHGAVSISRDNECNGNFSTTIGYYAAIDLMKTTFHRLNEGWNAEPNAPYPSIEVRGEDLVLKFLVNSFRFPTFKEDEIGVLRFVRCERYRLGSTNDEGWYLGQCRFSKLAPEWGEFYMIQGDAALLDAPKDWQSVRPPSGHGQHFLFYFRDETFECVAEKCIIEPTPENALQRTGKVLVAPG
jgi:hypothetical protein